MASPGGSWKSLRKDKYLCCGCPPGEQSPSPTPFLITSSPSQDPTLCFLLPPRPTNNGVPSSAPSSRQPARPSSEGMTPPSPLPYRSSRNRFPPLPPTWLGLRFRWRIVVCFPLCSDWLMGIGRWWRRRRRVCMHGMGWRRRRSVFRRQRWGGIGCGGESVRR